MADVKVLVAGSDNLNNAEKGDVVEVVAADKDWGSKTMPPDWLRLVITGVPGTQQDAENLVRAYLQSWKDEFAYLYIDGAPVGQQYYRVEASPEIANDLDLTTKQYLRDAVLVRFAGAIVSQSKTHFEFISYADIPLDEIAQIIEVVGFRRYKFPEALVDQALAAVPPGEPAEFTRTRQQVQSIIIDKLKS